MQQTESILKRRLKKMRVFPLAALMLFPLSSFAQQKKERTSTGESRVEVNYKQRHSPIVRGNDLYADGIKIKRDLSILKEIQQERVLLASEAPADDLYGGIWSERYVNSYRSLENVPDTFTVDLTNFSIPTTGHITSQFGPRRRRMHYGIDLKVHEGDTIYAAFDGKVRVKQYERRGYGYYLVLRHGNGLETVYGHLSDFLVEEGDVVKSGAPIGLGGNTGRSTGAHLHLEFRYVGRPINPNSIVDFKNKVCHWDSYKITPSTFSYPTRRGKAAQSYYSTLMAKTRSSEKVTNKYAEGKVGFHRVQSGDTLISIARSYGITVAKLCSLNNINKSTKIRAGKSLRVS